MKSVTMSYEKPSMTHEPTAAVAIIRSIIPTEAVLLLRRVTSSRDPWSGHFAFPGGRRERQDTTIYDTCIREVREETGISLPAESLEHVLSPALAGRNVKAPVLVQPYLFKLSDRPKIVIEPAEIESHLWIETALFRDKNRHFETEALPGRLRPAYPLGDYYVWGFTYYVLCSALGVEPVPGRG